MARRKRERRQAETDDEVKALARIDQLAEAVAERLSEGERARWTGLAVGLGFATLAGLIGMAIYLFLRRNSSDAVAGLGEGHSPITVINQLPDGFAAGARKKSKPKRVKVNTSDGLPEEYAQSTAVNRDTSMRTIRLATNAALRVMTAVGVNPWRVTLRVLGPPGSFAAFATDAARLRDLGSFVGDVLVVPAGEETQVHLSARQVLYGLGSTTNVSTSVVGSETYPAAAPQLAIVR